MTKPVCTSESTLPAIRANMLAAKITPAAVMTPPVAAAARAIPARLPSGASSCIRLVRSRL